MQINIEEIYFHIYTVQPCYLELDGAKKKILDFQGFEIWTLKYLKNMLLGLSSHFKISAIFDISLFKISSVRHIVVQDIKVQLYILILTVWLTKDQSVVLL